MILMEYDDGVTGRVFQNIYVINGNFVIFKHIRFHAMGPEIQYIFDFLDQYYQWAHNPKYIVFFPKPQYQGHYPGYHKLEGNHTTKLFTLHTVVLFSDIL